MSADPAMANDDPQAVFLNHAHRLQAAGLSRASLKSLIDEFRRTGRVSTSSALLAAGPEALDAIGQAQADLQRAATTLGASAAADLYQRGVDEAWADVEYLEAELACIDAEVTALKQRREPPRSVLRLIRWRPSRC